MRRRRRREFVDGFVRLSLGLIGVRILNIAQGNEAD